jgi:glycosyltransferase involved in cell wall biosynthesis
MKILLPFNTKNGVTLEDNVVTGGIEMFSRLMKENIDGVKAVYFNDDDRRSRTVTKKIIEAVHQEQPDVIVSSYDYASTTIRLSEAFPTIPVLWICHMGAGPFSKIKETESMNKFMENHFNTVFHVSHHQYNALNMQCQRFNKFSLNPVHGYIQPAFSKGNEEVSEEIEYEAITIGRSEKIKDPFWLHRKFKNKTSVNAAVCTDNNPKEKEYNDRNILLEQTKPTFRALPHEENMKKLARSGLHVSTCNLETWGITVLEALARGVPAVFPTDGTGRHASEEIPASTDHYKLIKKSIKADDLIDVIKYFNKFSHEKRIEISEMTKEKHSAENWISNVTRMLDMTVENKKQIAKKDFFI